MKILCMSDELLVLCWSPNSLFALGFWQFDCNVSLCESLCIYTLEVCWLLEYVDLCILRNLGNFWRLFLPVSSLPLSLLCIWGCHYVYVGMRVCVPRFSWSLHIYLHWSFLLPTQVFNWNPLVSFSFCSPLVSFCNFYLSLYFLFV